MPYTILKQKNSYFKNLSSEAQEIFVARLFNFMEDKKFIGREGMVVTDEIKVLISAAAIQLTFGLKDYMISHLHAINVFPRVFYSKFLKTNLKGLNTQSGVLSLSWNDFKDGFAVEDDKINLGLHELAHALYIDSDEDGNYHEHFSAYMDKWEEVAENDFYDLIEKKNIFLRSYGGTNMHEFFAVCVEHFFEAPNEFKKELPHLYNYLMLMLNQDLCNTKDDYKVRIYAETAAGNTSLMNFKRETKLNEDILKNSNVQGRFSLLQSTLQRNGIYIAMTATFIGLFVGIPSLIWFWSTTVISLAAIFIMVFSCGALGMVQWKYARKYIDMEYHQFSMYAFSGFGMCLINIIFSLNTLFPIYASVNKYEIVSFNNGQQGLEVTLAGEGHHSSLERNVAEYLEKHFENFYGAKKVTVITKTGLFGMDRIQECLIRE